LNIFFAEVSSFQRHQIYSFNRPPYYHDQKSYINSLFSEKSTAYVFTPNPVDIPFLQVPKIADFDLFWTAMRFFNI
jgi:hypothetical protein